MKMRQTNLKQTYIPPEIIVEEFFDDETLLAASPILADPDNSNDMTGDGDPKPEDAKSTLWSPDFSSFDDEDY